MGSQNFCHDFQCKYSSLFDPRIYKTAYRKVQSHSRKRPMRGGSGGKLELDIFSVRMIPSIINQMKDRSFQFQPLHTEFVQQGNAKMLPVGTPSILDKVVQEAFRSMLEPVFEQKFTELNFGYKPVQTAFSTLRDIRSWTGTTWLIAGSKIGILDSMDHEILGNLIMKEVKDQQILDLYQKLVRAGLVNNSKQQHHNLTGVSKGRILWPLFVNIYLHEFDVWLKKLTLRISTGDDALNLGFENTLDTCQNLSLERERVDGQGKHNQEVTTKVHTEIHYARYADQWVVGVDGPKRLAVQIKDEILVFLTKDLNLQLCKDDITITHLGSDKAKFLGTLIGTRNKKYTESLVKGRAERAFGRIFLEAPINELVQKLVDRGFANDHDWPRGMSAWIHLEPEEIMRRYRAITQGLLRYYSMVDNKNMMRRIIWILRFSAAFTLCRKWRISTAALFRKLATTQGLGDFIIKPPKPSERW